MNAPRRHHPAALMNGLSDLLVVVRPDRVACAPQLGRIGRQEGVQVHHLRTAVPQPLGEPDAPADAGIVDVLVGAAWVEHDEGQHRTIGPVAPEAVAERAARGEQRGAVHTRPMIFSAGGTGTTPFTAFSTFWPAVSRNWCPGTPSHVAAVLMNGGLKAGKGGEAGDCGFRQTGPWRLRPRWFLTDCLKLLTR